MVGQHWRAITPHLYHTVDIITVDVMAKARCNTLLHLLARREQIAGCRVYHIAVTGEPLLVGLPVVGYRQ